LSHKHSKKVQKYTKKRKRATAFLAYRTKRGLNRSFTLYTSDRDEGNTNKLQQNLNNLTETIPVSCSREKLSFVRQSDKKAIEIRKNTFKENKVAFIHKTVYETKIKTEGK